MATRSSGRSLPSSRRIDSFTNGSLFGWFIEPDTSSRKTRLAAGRSAIVTSRPFNPMRTNRCSDAQGADATSIATAKGVVPCSSPSAVAGAG